MAPVPAIEGLNPKSKSGSRLIKDCFSLIANVILALSPQIYSNIQMLRQFSKPRPRFKGKLSEHGSKLSLRFLYLRGDLAVLEFLSASFQKAWPGF